ncbi:cysteine--tRNA ligase [candidate division WOR-3 bacterium]|nr:cysteine--tRNA ligase [candidate division WOR-3 bacterium]
MGLRLYNTLTRKTEEFKPRGDTVGIYTCGLTVQGPPHVGHIRSAITRDILIRWLEYSGYTVKSIENFTDIDDKIIEKQRKNKEDWRIIAHRHIEKYLRACDILNIKRATFYPWASQHMEEIIVLVKKLIDKSFAYEKKGDVYFRVRKFPNYGRLSKKSIDELISGARIAPAESKEDPLDFALWKAAKPDEPSWLSPWGKGRPGWHIECSAMSMHYLGESFDIHTGGEDLIFPHHENEIAQSVAATGKEYVRYWMHNGWVTLGGEKMAKSTGHYFLIEDVLKNYSPNVIRLYLLKTQYRNQIEFSKDRLDEAKAAYSRIKIYVEEFKELPEKIEPLMLGEFTEAMNDDLNTPKALGKIYDLVKKGHEKKSVEIAASIKHYLAVLGFREEVESSGELSYQLIDIILHIRNKLRNEKKYDLADEIRTDLENLGIKLADTKGVSLHRLEDK